MRAPGISIVEHHDVWVLRAGALSTEYDDLDDALKAMNALLPDYPNQVDVDYHVELDELMLWADEDEGLLPQAINGWLHGVIGWMPVETAEDPTDSETLLEWFDFVGRGLDRLPAVQDEVVETHEGLHLTVDLL